MFDDTSANIDYRDIVNTWASEGWTGHITVLSVTTVHIQPTLLRWRKETL